MNEQQKNGRNEGTLVDEFLNRDKNFRSMLLDRLRSDCEYYLGYGNRYSGCLWAHSEKEQIACMKALWNSFQPDEKPHYLTLEKISDYEQQMVYDKPPLSSIISSASMKASEQQVYPDSKTIETSYNR